MTLSPRLAAILDALPPLGGLRVLEIGCGPGALARAMAARGAFVLGIDRSARAVAQARAVGGALIAAGRLDFREGLAEEAALRPGEAPFDLALAIRVGVLDGRHPKGEAAAKAAITAMLRPGGRLMTCGGDPLRVILTA